MEALTHPSPSSHDPLVQSIIGVPPPCSEHHWLYFRSDSYWLQRAHQEDRLPHCNHSDSSGMLIASIASRSSLRKRSATGEPRMRNSYWKRLSFLQRRGRLHRRQLHRGHSHPQCFEQLLLVRNARNAQRGSSQPCTRHTQTQGFLVILRPYALVDEADTITLHYVRLGSFFTILEGAPRQQLVRFPQALADEGDLSLEAIFSEP